MHIRKFTFNPFEENTWLVADDDGSCVIIDPGCSGQRENSLLSNRIRAEGWSPKCLLLTHAHIDHCLGLQYVYDTYGLRPILHPQERAIYQSLPQSATLFGMPQSTFPEPEYSEETLVSVGNLSFERLFVPGHSPGHVAWLHRGTGSLFSGDVLFRESIGRTDLPGGDYATLMRSIHEVLLKLPDATRVYAGHMGLTTIGHERSNNPFIRSAQA